MKVIKWPFEHELTGKALLVKRSLLTYFNLKAQMKMFRIAYAHIRRYFAFMQLHNNSLVMEITCSECPNPTVYRYIPMHVYKMTNSISIILYELSQYLITNNLASLTKAFVDYKYNITHIY